jgi:hypothetical protein
MAYDISRRVYAENDRRDLTNFVRPMPGVAREYWPTDLRQWDASEGYGWGATTASFVIRQLCGFYESEDPDGCGFRLAPRFPRALIEDRELVLGPLPYRGRVLRLAYRASTGGWLEIDIGVAEGARLRAQDERTGELLVDAPFNTTQSLRLATGRTAHIDLLG